MNTTKNKRKYARKVSTEKTSNPFVIETGVPLTGNRRGVTNIIAKQLAETVKKLPVDKNVSVFIPKSAADSKNQITNLVLAVRRLLSEDKHVAKNFAITMRTFKDNNGEFANSRIWRIS